MNDALYHFLTGALDLFVWGGELIGEENLPHKGPGVFIANHLDATGPIACCCSIPLRLYPWSIGDMMDPQLAPAYMNMDFTERLLHLKPPVSTFISRLLTRVTVPMFWSLGCIPVYKGDYTRMQATLQLSMNILRQDRFILVFPEDPSMQPEALTGMKPFQHTFARLGELVYAETARCLPFFPLAVHPKGKIHVGMPVAYNPTNPVGVERQRIKSLIEATIHKMYLQLDAGGGELGVLTPARK